MDDLREFALQPDGTYVIDGDMLISDILLAFPRSAGVMLKYGLHCVGCHANAFDTLEGGAKGHGLEDNEISDMISEINQLINKNADTIELTPKAIAKAKEFRLEEDGKEDWPLRIKVLVLKNKFSYELDFDNAQDGDKHFDFDGLEVVMDAESFSMFKGSTVDYVENQAVNGFKIDNPNPVPFCDDC